MRIDLRDAGSDDALVRLSAQLPPQSTAVALRYATRTGALLRVDGSAAGAYDREHHAVVLPPCERARELLLEVERQALPTNGLPSGPGVGWWLLNALSHPAPARTIELEAAPVPADGTSGDGGVAVIGHSHLDVAWLWTYAQTARKAERTFATAVELLEEDPQFVFAQSQPQLYAYVEERDPALFARVRELAAAERFDPEIAAMWVEPDCNLPSGESLLRQLLFGHRYCTERFGVAPSIAWLPDSFGFANTLPQLLAHAGVRRFLTTKLQWNDTTRFPYPHFRWRGPDASEVVGALVQSYDGGLSAERIRVARERAEPVIAGYGDGGGGVTREMLADVRRDGAWIRPGAWFAQLEARRDALPVHADELYLEYHRGVYTTHHDLKARNALLERALGEAEELAAWCVAVRAPRAMLAGFRERLRGAWEIVLRNQFHDVLPGTSIEPVHLDALAEYAQAGEAVAAVIVAAQQALPKTRGAERAAALVPPQREGGAYRFESGLLRAVVEPSGAVSELATPGGPNVCSQANVLALYRDRPKKWEAWNIDAGYDRRMRAAKPQAHRVEDGALVVELVLGSSPATMRLSLREGEPFLRVDLRVDWRERRTLLRVEHWLALRAAAATYGTPHGTIERSARNATAAERAKFEVPGQRFAFARGEDGAGFVCFALDTYGWSARALGGGGLRLGHSLLRGTCWPDPHADLGEHAIAYALAPAANASIGAVEQAWRRFAHEPRVRLFTCDDPAVLVVACKPAEDGDGAIVRVRECDGAAREVALRCGGRMREAMAVDALERPVAGDAAIVEESLRFTLAAHGLRSFRVRF